MSLEQDRPTDADDPSAAVAELAEGLLTTLTTEHFTLQGARSTTVSESSARAALYVGALSSTLVALGFVSQVASRGDLFRVIALVTLPSLYMLGVFTFARLLETAVEDLIYGRAINRIRHFYLEQARGHERYFLLTGHDDAEGVLANMGLGRRHGQILATAATMLASLNAVVGGAAAAFACAIITGCSLGVAVGTGAAVATFSLAVCLRIQDRRLTGIDARIQPVFPSGARS